MLSTASSVANAADNMPPTVSITAENPQTNEGSSPYLPYDASDPDGEIVAYHWETSEGRTSAYNGDVPAPIDNGTVTYTLTVAIHHRSEDGWYHSGARHRVHHCRHGCRCRIGDLSLEAPRSTRVSMNSEYCRSFGRKPWLTHWPWWHGINQD